MSFPAGWYVALGLGAFLATAVTLPFWRAWSRQSGLVDEPGERKVHESSMPLAGGLAILSGLLTSLGCLTVIWKLNLMQADVAERIGYGLSHRAWQLSAILAGALGITLLGWLDDRHELRASAKFGGQLLVAALVALAGIRITLFVPSLVFSYTITVLWILTVINAFNFMDNMNGLCAGLGVIATFLLGLTSALHGQYLVASISFLVSGAVFGFLPYNYPRATVFLGDTGSHLIGYLLAVLAILPHFYTEKTPHHWAVLTPLLILALPLTDLAWVVGLRWRLGRPFYIGDTNHLSHRLVRRGLNPAQAVLLIWFMAAAVGVLALFWI